MDRGTDILWISSSLEEWILSESHVGVYDNFLAAFVTRFDDPTCMKLISKERNTKNG